MTLTYDGTNYNGYQKQPNGNTIQDNIEKNLSIVLNEKIGIVSSGRTDAKVHAINAKAHFDTDKKIDLEKLKKSMNQLINNDIYIKSIKKVSSTFHARFSVKEKEYIYKINLNEYNPIERDHIFQYNKPLNIDAMEKASAYFIGEHNFKSLTKNDVTKTDFMRIIYSIKFKYTKGILEITFKGNGFLRYMVRNMVGLLIEVGSGKRNPDEIKKIIDSCNRTNAGITAPPTGLYLKNVKY